MFSRIGVNKGECNNNLTTLVNALENSGAGVKEVIILIGSGPHVDTSWCQNLVFNSSNNHLIINIDPHFKMDLEKDSSINTHEKLYLGMHFDGAVSSRINNAISELLNKNIKVVFCDFRSPAICQDIHQLMMQHIEDYCNPNTTEGNLIYLQGYFECYPLFWPTKEYLVTMKDTLTQTTSKMSDYADAMTQFRSLTGGKWADNISYFDDKPGTFPLSVLLPSQNNGMILSYPHVKEISMAKMIDAVEPSHCCVLS
ncbi:MULTISPECIES: hypothetical protein [Legionella]|uniref:hypothetical protein n=1 Tax=Legionella TaxID=445 RepID=UPI00095D1683|nr:MULTISPECIES: hypothetical protein [Legionella]MBN9226472.1 hypothetical protein [Legionella steelei]OJW12205.1 MAG: hypothetical protein BGO44_04025 [Legionella sp. 39-23]